MPSDSVNRTQDAGQLDAPRQTPTSSSTNSNETIQSLPAALEQTQHQYPYQPVPLQQTSTQATMAYQQPQGHQETFDLKPINNTLFAIDYRPQYSTQYLQGHNQQFSSTTSPHMAHQMTPMSPYGGAAMPMPSHPYYVQQQQIPQYYAASHLSQAQNPLPLQGRQNMVYYPSQMMMSPAQTSFYYPHSGQYSGHSPAMPAMASGAFANGALKSQSSSPPHQANENPTAGRPLGAQEAPEATQSTVRGPPRKPRQSGHALWIGNLPPQTNLMTLVHHVCKITPGMESLFLISKSNCAFANFKDEPACSAAQKNLHDSKFQSVRLVSRLRKSTVEGSTGSPAPTGPAANSTPSTTHEGTDSESAIDDSETMAAAPLEVEVATNPSSPVPMSDSKARQSEDKFFILKSLTTEDLNLSVQTGIWATQSHNESNLNEAFQTADNVYLIFSANKSGEYFGYARMISEINEDPAAAIKFAPKVVSTAHVDLPKAIPTDATEYAPRGKIIDDSARGTIFWEAERDDAEAESDMESESTSDNANGTEDETKVWGKPFKLEWLSTSRLPFFRTRGLRNPWNSNREVKIARDGTELEPSIGRRLIGLFNRVQNPTMVTSPARTQMNFMPGYPMMRPY